MHSGGQNADQEGFEEVLLVLQQYLSDLVPPLMLVNEGQNLFEIPLPMLAGEIKRWVALHYRSGENKPASDYLYHVARKIHQLGELQIFPEEDFLPFQQRLIRVLVELCPVEDRDNLIVDLAHLSEGGSLESAPVHVGHRGGPGKVTDGNAGVEARGPSERRTPATLPVEGRALTPENVQRLELLLKRLERATAAAAETNGEPAAAETPVVAETVISAAETAGNARQLQELLATLNVPGLPSSPSELLNVLAQRLPDWAPPTPSIEPPSPRTVEAMHKVVTTAESPAEAHRRYEHLADMAAQELNRGSLGRAVNLLDLAQRMVEKGDVDQWVAERVAERGAELLDADRLREYAATESAHPLLRRLLSFFHDLSPTGLLGRLLEEEQREDRRLTISLLKVYGAEVRPHILELLEASIKEGGTLPWYYERNLILLLREIPPTENEDRNREIDALIWLARPGGPLAGVREALTALGSIHDPRTEKTLIATVTDLERALAGDLELPYAREEIDGLLDRAVGALACMPFRNARRRVVRHALDRRTELEPAIERMTPLGQQDLSDDPELVQYLVDALLDELPVKVFGKTVMSGRRSAIITGIIQALSGTDAPQVRKALSEVAQRYPGKAFSTEAERVLARLGGPREQETEQTSTMAGDLELLSLPNLLQNIADAHLTGTLTLLDRDAATAGTLHFRDGMLETARRGHLEGETALFQVFQMPQPARFVFTCSLTSEGAEQPGELHPVLPLLLEGMRRLDEFRCAEAIVPADAVFSATSKPPTPVPGERDEALVQTVWQAAASGQTPAQVEAELPADSYRIRRMYEHWLQDGALTPAAD